MYFSVHITGIFLSQISTAFMSMLPSLLITDFVKVYGEQGSPIERSPEAMRFLFSCATASLIWVNKALKFPGLEA